MAQSPTIYNKTLTVADTEYSQQLPADTRRWSMQCRTAFDVRFAFVTGKVDTATPVGPYGTLKSGDAFNDQLSHERESVSQLTVFLASGEAGVVVEIIVWN